MQFRMRENFFLIDVIRLNPLDKLCTFLFRMSKLSVDIFLYNSKLGLSMFFSSTLSGFLGDKILCLQNDIKYGREILCIENLTAYMLEFL